MTHSFPTRLSSDVVDLELRHLAELLSEGGRHPGPDLSGRARMKAAVVVFPGSNCDRDVQVALRQSMGREPIMVWHKDSDFEKVDLIVLPGGFSYGDYLRCGAMAANPPVMKAVVARAHQGVNGKSIG